MLTGRPMGCHLKQHLILERVALKRAEPRPLTRSTGTALEMQKWRCQSCWRQWRRTRNGEGVRSQIGAEQVSYIREQAWQRATSRVMGLMRVKMRRKREMLRSRKQRRVLRAAN